MATVGIERMTLSTSNSVFRNAALASGLLSQQQLNDALAGLAVESAQRRTLRKQLATSCSGSGLLISAI